MVPARLTIQSAYAALDGAQSHPKPMQVMGITVLFVEVCKGLRLDPSEMLDKARRLTRHAEEHYSVELKALADYIQKELKQ